jgi:hypothetical protein
MKTIRIIIATIIIIMSVLPGQCQNIEYGNRLRQKVKTKLDSLYPHASGRVIFNDKYVSDTTQEVEIKCNCQEFSDEMIIQFDTSGNLLIKDMYFGTLKGLPDTILTYMKRNTTEIVRFDFSHMIKSINSKGEVSYNITMLKRSTTSYQTSERYLLKFKSSGELISKELIPEAHD